MSVTYTSTAKWFHWLIVLLVGLELVIAVLMPDVHRNTTPDMLMNLHFSFGITIIIVMILRVLWRLTHRAPPLPAGTSRGQALAAQLMHFALYALLFVIPFAGWVWANALGFTVTLFGLVSMPALVPKGSSLLHIASRTHAFLAGTIVILIGLHVLAALWHWYYEKDDVLERMLPTDTYTTRLLAYFDSFRR
jgi:cytochrome b561